jgi:hypothetical protein
MKTSENRSAVILACETRDADGLLALVESCRRVCFALRRRGDWKVAEQIPGQASGALRNHEGGWTLLRDIIDAVCRPTKHRSQAPARDGEVVTGCIWQDR